MTDAKATVNGNESSESDSLLRFICSASESMRKSVIDQSSRAGKTMNTTKHRKYLRKHFLRCRVRKTARNNHQTRDLPQHHSTKKDSRFSDTIADAAAKSEVGTHGGSQMHDFELTKNRKLSEAHCDKLSKNTKEKSIDDSKFDVEANSQNVELKIRQLVPSLFFKETTGICAATTPVTCMFENYSSPDDGLSESAHLSDFDGPMEDLLSSPSWKEIVAKNGAEGNVFNYIDPSSVLPNGREDMENNYSEIPRYFHPNAFENASNGTVTANLFPKHYVSSDFYSENSQRSIISSYQTAPANIVQFQRQENFGQAKGRIPNTMNNWNSQLQYNVPPGFDDNVQNSVGCNRALYSVNGKQ